MVHRVPGRGPASGELGRRRLLEVVLWALLAITGAVAAATALGLDLPWNRRTAWITACVGLVYALALALLQRGHTRPAAHLLVVGVVLGSWAPTLAPGGIGGDRSYAFVATNILIASFAINIRAGALVAGIDAAAMASLWRLRAAYGSGQFAEDLLILGVFSIVVLAIAQHNESDRRSLRQAQRRLEDALAMQEALVQNSADAIVAVSGQGEVVACNRVAGQWAREHGLHSIGVGMRFEDALPQDLQSHAGSLVEEARRAGAVRSEFTWNSDRGPAWVQMFLHALPGGTVTVQVRDVTQERRLQIQERKAYRDRVELEKLREMDRFRMRLLNTASHELRTPITPLRLQLSLLQRHLEHHRDSQAHNSLEVMGRNVDRLALLADDLLDVARLEAGKMPIEAQSLDLDSFVQQELQGYEAVAEQAQVHLEVSTGSRARVHADPARLAQVLTNLITNAIKYGGPGSHVRLETRLHDAEAVVEVHDDGAGFPAHKRDALFQPFSQLHDGDARRQGSGLGLYICKGIIEGHGGRIWGSSPGVGQGATFAIALPAAPRAMLKGRRTQVPSDD